MSLPTEPFLFGVMGLFFLKLITERKFDKKVLVHPVSISIYFYLIWLFLTSLSSELPIVSFKYLLVRLWFIVNFYFLVTQLVEDKSYISKYLWAYTFGLMIVIGITLFKHAQEEFTQKAGHYVMHPFFNDHTSYGAALAMILPAIVGITQSVRKTFNIRFLQIFAISIILIALVFSYTRAAWLSLVVAIGIWILIKLRIKFRSLIIISVLSLSILIPISHSIMYSLEKNDEVSSTDFSAHIKSMSNITTDASNLERINRWKCALRMFEERPIMGWGPGTYMFLYAPFQHSEDRTIISTNAADLGNAHSEYLGLLSEAGFIGSLSFILIIIITLTTAFRLYYRTQDNAIKKIVLFLSLGLITYYVHAFLNNFLDYDKIAILFWSFTAIIVALDIQDKESLSKQNI
ncbi:MAG: O-antigen ligase family protein [Bacteroidales bacterium]|nr:O-antigen ligase family protein [Bacteroidales bacterium]